MKTRPSQLIVLQIACLAAGAGLCSADTAMDEAVSSSPAGKPRWEIGLVGAVGRLPEYRAAEDYKTYILPLPFFVYRGDIIQADREGARGIFWKPVWGEFDFSFFGSPPVIDSDARVGMPDLDPLLEAGPAMRVYIKHGRPGPDLYLRAALRGVVSVGMDDLGLNYRGLRGDCKLQLDGYRLSPNSPWNAGAAIGVNIDDDEYNSYFYDVRESEAIPGRPAYKSHGGYGGAFLSAYVARRLGRSTSGGIYTRWDNFDGAAFEGSPLARTSNNYVLGAAITWTFAESKEIVKRVR